MLTFKITCPPKGKIAFNYSHSDPGWHIGSEAAPAVTLSPLPTFCFSAFLLPAPHPYGLLYPVTSTNTSVLHCPCRRMFSCVCQVSQAQLHIQLGHVWQFQEQLLCCFLNVYNTL